MGKPLFQINILPVGEGDCIHLRFFSDDKWYNIIIDSGSGKNKEVDPEEEEENQKKLPFLKLLRSIQTKPDEVVDLLCFTHIDDDHIEAAKLVFSKDQGLGKLIKEVWLNIPEYEAARTKPKTPGGLEHTSVNNALELYRYLLWYKENRGLVCETKVLVGKSFHSKDVKVSVVLPDQFRLERFEEAWEKYSPRDGTLVPISTKKNSDQSKTNGASIVLLVEAFGWRMLFTGDTFAVNLTEMIKEQKNEHYDLVKLPHHGSSANITKSLLKMLNCKCFVISADGKGERLEQRRPDKATVDILGEYGKKHGGVTLYGNYKWTHIPETEGVQIITLTGEEKMLTESISIKSEEPKC